jgi:hypothetical protein
MSIRGCVNYPNCFCYICGKFMIKKHQRNITGFISKVYYSHFDVKLGDQHKSWAPHKVCFVCVQDLRKWSKEENKAFRFGVSMIWRELKNHSNDCYFAVAMLRVTTLKIKNLSCT